MAGQVVFLGKVGGQDGVFLNSVRDAVSVVVVVLLLLLTFILFSSLCLSSCCSFAVVPLVCLFLLLSVY